MKYTCWVLEIKEATVNPSVVPFPGVKHDLVPIHSYVVELDGAVGPDGIGGGFITITSAKPLTWRAGQNILIEVEDVLTDATGD